MHLLLLAGVAVVLQPVAGAPRLNPAPTAALAASDIEGSKWRVQRINRIRPPVSGRFTLDFRRGKLQAKFGCNDFAAKFRVEGGVLLIAKNESIEFYCSEPFAGFETEGFAILKQPISGRWLEGRRRLTLFNHAGSIDLVRR